MAEVDGTWRLHVRYPNSDPVLSEIKAPQSLEELRARLGMESGQTLLTNHHRHIDQQYMVERLDQLFDGAEVAVQVPRRRIYISVPDYVEKKAVMWYPGATVDQIEKAIAKAAGFQAGTPIELREGEASVVLSTTIPNDTHLEVIALGMESQMQSFTSASGRSMTGPAIPILQAVAKQEEVPVQGTSSARSAGSSGVLRNGAKVTGSTASAGMVEVKSGSRRLQSGGVSSSSMAATSTGGSVRRDRSPGSRAFSPVRSTGRAPGSGAPNTLPAVQQSAPEEHCIHILAGHTGFVSCLCGVGDILFTGSQDSNIMIWDLNNLQYIGTLPGHKGFVKSLYASYPKKVLVSGSQDRSIRIWSLETFSTVKTLMGHTGSVNAVLIIESQNTLVSGSEDKSIRVWDLTSHELVAQLDQAHTGGIFSLVTLPGEHPQVVSGARDRSLKVWDAITWQNIKNLHPPHYDSITSTCLAAKHGKFFSASRDRSIKEWDTQTLTNTMHTLHAHGDWVQALCMSASEDILFSGSKDGTIKVWDGELQCQDILQGHRGPVSAVAVVGNRLFSASHDRTVRVWRVEQYG
mmetsp:Transcript_47238/g.101115  ORF Transcript_47238/g.101115 Transcript_47238/m.101115 type:complete len:575 (+) Transcript_47238:113-1837(+)|eukprot:CAMPEP_0206435032 /NCGR_PEP_ID=MMETSP0324_2-20121206/9579_1 /ASSEMBLY_ACC=CAM_ASM_000836 /TAXON_ID=2866 /ORGANISM="Crypthecodinium cohnii, Strain Seligo" /LENGTH=574 /DNA_ID=CAMNT_0053901795 /DNA_START=62 /DNA_END=1786 /DNA_ORIENTATION=+